MTDEFTSRAVNHLLRDFRPLRDRDAAEGGPVDITNNFFTAIPTVFVVSADAADWIKDAAAEMPNAFQCDGTDDHEEINAATDLGNSAPLSRARLVFSSGRFFLDPDEAGVSSNHHWQGMGSFRTTFHPQTVGTATSALITMSTDSELSDIGFDSVGTGYLGRIIDSSYGRIFNIQHGGDAAVAVWLDGAQHPTEHMYLYGVYTDAAIVVDEGWAVLNQITSLRSLGAGAFIRLTTSATAVTSITNCVVSYFGANQDGIVLEGGEVALSACSIQVPNAALRVDDGSPFAYTIQGCYLEGAYGVLVDGASPSWNTSVISGSVIFGSVRPFVFDALFRSVLSDLVVVNRGEHCFDLKDCFDIRITDVLITHIGLDTDGGHDVFHGVNCDRVYIDGVQVVHTGANRPAYFANFDGASADLIVVGCAPGDTDNYATGIFNVPSDAQLTYPDHATYGDNFVRGGAILFGTTAGHATPSGGAVATVIP